MRIVKIYWKTNPASVTVNKPNIQVTPSRGERMTQALRLFLVTQQNREKLDKWHDFIVFMTTDAPLILK